MILDRPLFRQAGGPIMPPGAPPPMPAGPPPMPPGPPPPPPGPSPEESVQAIEGEATETGRELGLDYLHSVTSALDGAEDYEAIINAIRGNDLSLQDRYDELADYVGEDDASATPESVLTMVQPTIMLTEEGAVDSGIGELMQNVLGAEGVEESPVVAEGIGELMAAGQAGPPMPVQNFAQGGIVQHFAQGTPGGVTPIDWIGQGSPFERAIGEFEPFEPREFSEVYEERLPFYEAILGTEEERKDRTRREMMLDLAAAGFNLAAGTDPRTGENIAGKPFLSQVGSVLSGMPKRASERLADQRKSEQASQLAALQSAERTQAAEATAAQAQGLQMMGGLISGAQGREALESRERIVDSQINAAYREFSEGIDEKIRAQGSAEAQETAIVNLRAGLQEERDQRIADLTEQAAQWDFGRKQAFLEDQTAANIEIMEADNDLQLVRIEENFKNVTARDKTSNEYQRGLVMLNGSVNLALQDAQRGWQSYENNQQRTWQGLQNKADRKLSQEALDLNKEKFKWQQLMSPSTEQGGWFARMFGGGKSEVELMREGETRLRDIQEKLGNLQVRAANQGLNWTDINNSVNNYMGLESLALKKRIASDNRLFRLLGITSDLQQASRGGFKDRQAMTNYTADPQNLQAYAAGAPMPWMEAAIAQTYKTETNPASGLVTYPNLPPALESAIRLRDALNIATVQGLGFQSGGEVMRDVFEPITGGTVRRRDLAAPEPYPSEPMITALPEGFDITKGTGSLVTPALEKIIEPFVGVIGDIAGGQDWKISEETSEAVRAINALNQMATMRTMQSLAGRESVQLMERIASLNVPAAEFFYDDTKALAQFKTASRVMDFAVREQDRLMSLDLPRKDRLAAEKELTALRGLQTEYDNVIKMYERKLGRGEEKDWNTALDQFFIN